MKKLHIINLEKMGGVERLFLQYINGNKDNNDNVICISNSIGEEIKKQLPKTKITFANRIFNALSLRCPQIFRKYLLQWKIERTGADVIIVWDLVPGLISKPKRGKLIYYDHGCSWRYAKNKKTLNFFSMLDGIIAVSHASKRVMELRFNLKCNVDVVLNRIQTPSGIDTSPRLLSQCVKLGTASRLVSLKGISVMLLTLQELINRGHNVMLEIAGKGPDQVTFEELANKLNLEKKVIFSGFQDNTKDFFNRIDIYLSTPVTEPFGLSSMEALYFSVPVVFPLIDGQPEAIRDGYCGIGVKPSVSMEEHKKLSGISIDFPHKVYDPVNDFLIEPQVLSHIACADAVEQLLSQESYAKFSGNAQRYVSEKFDYNDFKSEFNTKLSHYVNNKLLDRSIKQ